MANPSPFGKAELSLIIFSPNAKTSAIHSSEIENHRSYTSAKSKSNFIKPKVQVCFIN